MEQHFTIRTYKGTEQYKPKDKEETKPMYCFENADGICYKNTLPGINLPELKPNSKYLFIYDHWETRKNGWRQFDRLSEIKLLTQDVLKSLLGDSRKA